MHLLPSNCTVQDVENADSEMIYYSLNSERDYTTEVITEMAAQLTMRGL